MKTLLTASLVTVTAAITGYWLGQQHGQPSDASSSARPEQREVLYYKAPMDPNYRRDTPGKSPMGMDLVPVYANSTEDMDEGGVRISPTVVNNLGVRTAFVQRGPLAREISTIGVITYDEDTLNKTSVRVEGWIEQLNVTATGDPVIQGQTLFELYSPDLVNAQEEYLAALQSRNKAIHNASRDRLAALGLSVNEIERLGKQRTLRQRTAILAPTAGVVTHLAVREGQFVTPANDIMTVGSLDNLWLLVEVIARQSSWVAQGQSVRVSAEAMEGPAINAIVDYVYPELDPKTRTLTARIRLSNPDGALKPNMFARATIQGQGIDDALHIPQQALIRGSRANRVVIQMDEGRFRSQPVTVGIEANNRVQIISGLAQGDRVVTSGQFLIDSESHVESAMARLGGASTEHNMPRIPAPEQDHKGEETDDGHQP